ncbi:DNA/RNA non-specific endonuclease [Streptomyces purpureus]|uniref:DNA/RNA non-specific endonuclease n=1 Tax=Streptomyces purpureus TaxID=1951 RepID=UPI003797AF20
MNTRPVSNGSSGNGVGRDDDSCNKPREQRFHYQPLVQGRPTGARALLCPADLKPNGAPRDGSGDVQVFGFPDADANKKPGGRGTIYNRAHIIGDKVGGEWRSENLFTGHERMNKSGMRRCEVKMEKQLAAKNPVYYSGQLIHGSGPGGVDAIRMTASTRNGPLFDVVVRNISDWQATC